MVQELKVPANQAQILTLRKGNFPEFNYPEKLRTMLQDGLYLPYFFDVVDYFKITNPDLKEHIDRVGKIFYSKKKLVNE